MDFVSEYRRIIPHFGVIELFRPYQGNAVGGLSRARLVPLLFVSVHRAHLPEM